MARHDCDLLVVGGGPGGYVAALYAARQGLSVQLVEKDAALGGTCLNRGCIPTKALLHSAVLWKSLRDAKRWGVSAGGASFDFARIMRNKDGIVAGLTGEALLAHVASHQGMVAVDAILGVNSTMRYDAVPSCIYTRPEAAGVGLTEREARELYGNALVGTFPFAASGRARCSGETAGMVKIIAEPRERRIVGAHILGPGATELVAELTLAVETGCTPETLIRTVHAHPTLSEASMEASLDLVGTPLHKLRENPMERIGV